MARVRVTNKTDEEIVIKPGDSVDLQGEEDILRVMASRVKTLDINSFEDK